MTIMRSIRARLISTYLLLIILPIGSLGWFMLQAFDRLYLSQLQDDMNVEAGLMAEDVADSVASGQTVKAESLINSPPRSLQAYARVFLFDTQSRLIAASDSTFANVLGLSVTEPGLKAALAGRSSRGIETSPTTGVEIAYVAQPVVSNGKVVGAIHLAYDLVDIQDAQSNLRYLILGAVVMTSLLAGLISLRLTRGIMEPLARLDAAAANIAGGNFAHRVSENAPTELAALARSFNRMAYTLQAAEQSRQNTFANIAHDVRTPLGSIQAAAEALESGAAEQPDLRARLINGLIDQVSYLSRLTADLLQLATYEGGGLTLRRAPLALPPLIEQAVRAAQPQAEARGVNIEVDIGGPLPSVTADADRVLEALFNLLDNALRYTPPSCQIRVCAEADPTHQVVWVHVCDGGPGIPAEALPHLFERYWRGDYRRIGTAANMGLGLSIVREIVKAHGGKIAATNLPGGGADFYFSLPILPA